MKARATLLAVLLLAATWVIAQDTTSGSTSQAGSATGQSTSSSPAGSSTGSTTSTPDQNTSGSSTAGQAGSNTQGNNPSDTSGSSNSNAGQLTITGCLSGSPTSGTYTLIDNS